MMGSGCRDAAGQSSQPRAGTGARAGGRCSACRYNPCHSPALPPLRLQPCHLHACAQPGQARVGLPHQVRGREDWLTGGCPGTVACRRRRHSSCSHVAMHACLPSPAAASPPTCLPCRRDSVFKCLERDLQRDTYGRPFAAWLDAYPPDQVFLIQVGGQPHSFYFFLLLRGAWVGSGVGGGWARSWAGVLASSSSPSSAFPAGRPVGRRVGGAARARGAACGGRLLLRARAEACRGPRCADPVGFSARCGWRDKTVPFLRLQYENITSTAHGSDVLHAIKK